MTDDDASFILEGLEELRGYTQREPATPEQIAALLESFERHKKRLVVPAARVAEFEASVRAAGLGHAITVVGHAWLDPEQAYLMQSEAEFDADMQAAIEKDLQEQIAAETARMRAYLDWEQAQRMLEQCAPPRSSWRGVITGI